MAGLSPPPPPPPPGAHTSETAAQPPYGKHCVLAPRSAVRSIPLRSTSSIFALVACER